MQLPQPEMKRIHSELWAEAIALSDATDLPVRAAVEPSELVPGVYVQLYAIGAGKKFGVAQIIDLHTGRYPEFTARAIGAMAERLRVQIIGGRPW